MIDNANPSDIDLQPHTTGQAPDHSDILNVGGLSDAVFASWRLA